MMNKFSCVYCIVISNRIGYGSQKRLISGIPVFRCCCHCRCRCCWWWWSNAIFLLCVLYAHLFCSSVFICIRHYVSVVEFRIFHGRVDSHRERDRVKKKRKNADQRHSLETTATISTPFIDAFSLPSHVIFHYFFLLSTNTGVYVFVFVSVCMWLKIE